MISDVLFYALIEIEKYQKEDSVYHKQNPNDTIEQDISAVKEAMYKLYNHLQCGKNNCLCKALANTWQDAWKELSEKAAKNKKLNRVYSNPPYDNAIYSNPPYSK